MMEQLLGQFLQGRYRLDAFQGEGGMGAVFRAHDLTLERDVAIKIMHPQFARQPDFRKRFLQEARTAARLDHPGIVKVHDFGQAQGHLYIVMEFIPGDNLREMLQNHRVEKTWIVLPEALELVRQVCLAIHYAHQEGVLHRDIKPDNIMLKPKPSNGLPYCPVLTDLGLAKLAEGGLLTQEGVSMGTPAYMSPEQALGEKTDARSDVYSLGILLYELAVGRLPFRVRTLTEAIRCHTQEPPPPPRSLHPDLPEALDRAILKTLQKKPDDRFADAEALATVVQALAPGAALDAAPPTAVEGAVSLLTQYEKSLSSARGPSILDEFPAPPDLTRDYIQIRTPDEPTRSVEVKAGGGTIGREADSDFVVNCPSVSRQHARVVFDGQDCQVTDLGSANGTFLGNVRLLPGMPEAWTPDKALRIGDVHLRLVRAERSPSMETAIYRSDGTMVEPSLIHRSTGAGRVGIFAAAEQLSVAPGASTIVPVIVLNQHKVVDHFMTSVEGIPSSWVRVAPSTPVRLLPGQQQEVNLTIQPSRSPGSRAGRHRVTIRVASQDAPDEVAEVRQTLTVGAYCEFSSELQPQRVRAGSSARVAVHNRGNTRQAFSIAWTDRADELAFQPPQTQLTVAKGQAATAEFRARPRQRRWIGGEKIHPFTARVDSADAEAQTHSGELVSRGLLPVWVLPLLLFLCVAVAAAAALGANLVREQNAHQTQTAQASQTVGAMQIAAAQTATAGVDSDGDGLTDAQEKGLGTNPADDDTDDDLLSDGDEVNGWQAGGQRFQTDPLVADSDGDGLSDGEERQQASDPHVVDTDGDTVWDGREVNELGTSPINRDTDGDGIPDNTDPDPGLLPTATHTPLPTPKPTSAPTSVPTPGPDDDSSVSPAGEERISFPPGGTSVAFTIKLAQNVAKAYVLRVLGQQHIFVSATGDTSLLVYDANDKPLSPIAQELSSPRRWEFLVPRTGDYTLAFQGMGDTSITVVIPPLDGSIDLERIRFASGATSTSFPTTLIYGETQGYVLGAMSGQWMYVVLSDPTVDVVVRDPNDSLLSAVSANQKGRWEFHLPQTGDYDLLLEGVGEVVVTIEIPPP